MVQFIKFVDARLVITESNELEGNVFLGTTFSNHTLDQAFDEPSNVSPLPFGVCQDVEA